MSNVFPNNLNYSNNFSPPAQDTGLGEELYNWRRRTWNNHFRTLKFPDDLQNIKKPEDVEPEFRPLLDSVDRRLAPIVVDFQKNKPTYDAALIATRRAVSEVLQNIPKPASAGGAHYEQLHSLVQRIMVNPRSVSALEISRMSSTVLDTGSLYEAVFRLDLQFAGLRGTFTKATEKLAEMAVLMKRRNIFFEGLNKHLKKNGMAVKIPENIAREHSALDALINRLSRAHLSGTEVDSGENRA